MKSLHALTVAAVATCAAGVKVTVKSALSADEALLESKNRPVAKVINVLKDMLKQMEKEAEEDEEIYDAMACWCETNDKEKTKAIADAQTTLENLAVKIEELTARSGKLGVEIKNLEKEVAKNQAALDKAQEIRAKQQGEFNAEEKDLLGSISALKSALTVLQKHQGAALIQLPADHMKGVAATVKRAMDMHSDMISLTKSEKAAVASFIQAQPSSDGSYAPASGQIFGILEQMKETFETNLAATQKDENANQELFESVKAAKDAELAAGRKQIDTKTEELATTDEKNAEAKQNVKDTKLSLAADEEFLAMLKETCSRMDAEWEARQKTRSMEMEACSKALAVLTSDEAHDMFAKTFNFMQTGSMSTRRSQAAAVLKRYPRLAMISNSIKLDAFEKVKAAIQDMIGALQKEKADEIKHKDFCVEEFNTNQLATEKKTREKDELDTKIADLEQTIKDLTADLENLKAQIAEMAVQMKRAGEDREKENKDFQMTVADQRATQKLLNAALQILKGFYDKKNTTFDKVGLDQQPAGPPPPPGFKDYSKNKQAGGVQGMIQSIIDDAKAMENEAIVDEENAQKAYEDFVKESNASTEEKQLEATNKKAEKAKSDEVLVESSEARDAAIGELETLAEAKAALHQSCDFVMKNFELRQSARDEEIQAMQQAIAILSGAKFDDE
jgi:hypothetical protein